MKMTVAQALEKGYLRTRIQVEVLVDPVTGNILYPCGGKCLNGEERVTDGYTIMSDPADNPEVQPVNLRCNDCHKRGKRGRFAARLGGLVAAAAEVWLEGQWRRLDAELAKTQGWFDQV